MSKLEYLFKQFETILDWYKQSEEKAKFLIGLNTLVIGIVNGMVFVGADKIQAAREVYTRLVWVLLGLSGFALVGSFFFLLRAMWPRHHATLVDLTTIDKLWFFGDIARMSVDVHRSAMQNWCEFDLVGTMVAQNYILSKNVWTKHQAINWAIALAIISLALVFVLGIAYGFAVVNSPLALGIGGTT